MTKEQEKLGNIFIEHFKKLGMKKEDCIAAFVYTINTCQTDKQCQIAIEELENNPKETLDSFLLTILEIKNKIRK